MSDEVQLTEKAESVFLSLEPSHVLLVENHLAALGQSPTALRRPVVSPPYPPGWGMMYEFDAPIESGIGHHVVVFFRYTPDEKSLVVIDIGDHSLDDRSRG